MGPEESKRSASTSTSLRCCSSLAWSRPNRPPPGPKREQRRRPGREFRLRDIGSVGHERQSHPHLYFKHRRGDPLSCFVLWPVNLLSDGADTEPLSGCVRQLHVCANKQ